GECDRALSLLREMREEKGVKPNEKTFAAAISACGHGGKWERGLELLSEMPRSTGFLPDADCYT
ncbi:unnamed protein product, partial [Ectocarpus sp. 12 AP-2014]